MRDQFDREITYLRVSVTDLCNLRCRYCMPDGVCQKQHEDILSFEEITEIVSAAAALGVRKVRVTGGEPLVRKGCVDLVRMIAAIPGIEEVDMTTNGVLLSRDAAALKAAGLKRVNISLDSLNPEKYADITGGGSLPDALAGIKAAFDAGLTPVKINTVLIGGFNDDEIPDFVELTRSYPIELRFIELMPMGGQFGKEAYVPGSRVLEAVPALSPIPPRWRRGPAVSAARWNGPGGADFSAEPPFLRHLQPSPAHQRGPFEALSPLESGDIGAGKARSGAV